jgi:hypothetical protein
LNIESILTDPIRANHLIWANAVGGNHQVAEAVTADSQLFTLDAYTHAGTVQSQLNGANRRNLERQTSILTGRGCPREKRT